MDAPILNELLKILLIPLPGNRCWNGSGNATPGILSTGNGSGHGSGSAIGDDVSLILSFENASRRGSGSAIGCDMSLILSVDPTRSVLSMIGVLTRPDRPS